MRDEEGGGRSKKEKARGGGEAGGEFDLGRGGSKLGDPHATSR